MMKTVQINQKKEYENTTGFESEAMGIDGDALAHVMSVLTSLYSRPGWAVLREVVSNALDAHKDAGVSAPVQVQIPDYTSRVLVVKDEGFGMTKSQISKIYKMYGSSTKRGSNTQRGGFGLGCKSPLAITDRFEVTSVAKGGVDADGNQLPNELTEFYIEKDHNGVGHVYYTNHGTTDLPSGVEVRVPYPTNLISEFTNLNKVSEYFLGVKPSEVLFNGQPPAQNIHYEEQYRFNGKLNGDLRSWVEIDEGNDRISQPSGFAVNVLIGGILYRIDRDWLNKSAEASYLRFFRRHVFFELPIGSVDLTPNRENLIYSERTNEVLTTVLNEFKIVFERRVAQEINKQSSRWEAATLFAEYSEMGLWNIEGIAWRGEEIQVDLKLSVRGDAMHAPSLNPRYRSQKSSSHENRPRESVIRRTSMLDGSDKKSLTSNVLFVKHDAGFEPKKSLRYMKAVQEAFGYSTIIILGEEDWNNPWFEFLHREEFTTATQVIEAAREWRRKRLAEARAQRKKEGVSAVDAKAVAFFYRPNSAEPNKYVIERVRANDEEFKNLVEDEFYVFHESDHSSVFPYFTQTLTSGEEVYNGHLHTDRYSFGQISMALSGGKPIVVLTNRQNREAFMEKYPNAVSLIKDVRTYARERFVPENSYTWNDLYSSLDYQYRSRINTLIALYNSIEEAGMLNQVTDPMFHKLEAFSALRENGSSSGQRETLTAEDAEEAQWVINLRYWAGYSASNDENIKAMIAEATAEAMKIADRFFLAQNGAFSTGGTAEHIIAYLNVAGQLPALTK